MITHLEKMELKTSLANVTHSYYSFFKSKLSLHPYFIIQNSSYSSPKLGEVARVA
jgi:hypothetical protein